MRAGRGAVVIATALTAALLAGCATTERKPVDNGHGLTAALSSMPEREVGKTPQMRLAHGLIPPTNRWFSGLVFDKPQPVFPLPLSFALTDTGFSFGIPVVHSGADTITGGMQPDLSVDAGAASSKIVAYDEASVTIDELDSAGTSIGSVVIAEGSPLVSFTAKQDATLKLPRPLTRSGNTWSAKVQDSYYGLATKGEVQKDGGAVTLAKGQSAVWFAAPSAGSVDRVAALADPLESTSIKHSTSDKKVETAISYRNRGNGDTAFVAMPHQKADLDPSVKCELGDYPSIYGTLSLCSGTTLKWASPRVTADDSLPIDRLSAQQKSDLKAQVAKDTDAAPQLPTDTYFGGKALYRLANLLDLATQLGANDSATTLKKQLGTALTKWTDPKGCKGRDTECFVYDRTMRGMVGLKASFGADQFNDHHFHYGYFLYAASVAAAHDAKLAKKIAPVINLLAADLATSSPSKNFPVRRTFDAYAGHSWASGYSPFADGNNQESSSEAVSAWNGLALWAGVTKNAALKDEAEWMLSSEAASAKAYWTNFDTSQPVYQGYQHSIVPLNWGGKRDYATWFSADPSAKLSILVLPMSPVSGYLGGDPERIERNLQQGAPNGYDVTLGDYLVMYAAMAGDAQKAQALKDAEALPDKRIDDGNSRSYLLAWVMTR
ncbi:glycosyl hydrolase [Parafrigoribacterium soli]|uniref:glycosyl hydrolase n=1 Tax=Parafrigoribacterium soli TaxID=3144663 RepID=UPI0032EBCB8A